MSSPSGTPTRSPISKWGRLKNPQRDTPRKPSADKTCVSLEYTFNPQTQEMTENMRLVVVLRAGIKDPKGFLEAAWEASRLREPIQYSARPILIVHARASLATFPARRFYQGANKIKVLTSEQVALALECLAEATATNGRTVGPFDFADDYAQMLAALGAKAKPIITFVRDGPKMSIDGKTWPLATILEELGFRKDGVGYSVDTDFLEQQEGQEQPQGPDELEADVREMAAAYGFQVA